MFDLEGCPSTLKSIPYPDFATLPAPVKEKFNGLPTVVNIFRMLGYSAGTFVDVIDLTNAIFKKLTLSDYPQGASRPAGVCARGQFLRVGAACLHFASSWRSRRPVHRDRRGTL